MFQKLRYLWAHKQQGFSLTEYMIATILIGIIFAGVGKIMLSTVNNGRFSQKLTDVNLLSLKKATDLYNDSVNQANLIPENQTQIGSIDPNNPISGYFDLLNESGCLLGAFAQNPNDTPKDDDNGKGGKGGNPKGGKTNPIDNLNKDGRQNYGGGGTTLDCSTAAVLNPSNSLIPKFRRQWLIRKDFPNPKDVTACVIVVYQDTNTIARTHIITKSDGSTEQ
jgi:prepilin-type N-terminal cleavage/methylation domain-containing protein